ncbi:MAG: hypothetical protein BalsKO_18840 [Balneolaceae bacterium]
MKKQSLAVFLFMMIVVISCTNNSENLVSAPDDNEDDTQEPTEQVSYASDVQPIFNSRCTSCHGSSGNVNVSSYSALMSSVGSNYGNNVVVAGDADASGLVDKLEPNPTHGSRMPIGGTLTTDQIQTIRAWINEGAQNN